MTGADAASALAEGNRLRKDGRVAEAIEAYRRALAAAPLAGDAHYNLGIALRQAGDLRGAVLAFRAASRANPDDMDAVQNAMESLALAVERGAQPFTPAAALQPREERPASIVVCSIDPGRLATMQSSFRKALGQREHEFIVIRDARSLCEGYARGVAAARHGMVVFSHDDVELASGDAFGALQHALESHDIVGVAGSRVASGPAMAWSGQPHLFGGVAYPAGGGRHKATIYSLETGVAGAMQALDGLLFAARREAVLAVGFDATTFDGFHLYDLDFVYRAHRAGLRIAVTTEVLAIHASEGSFGDAWRDYAGRFLRKFPELDRPQGRHAFSFGRELASRDELVRFHAQLHALGSVP